MPVPALVAGTAAGQLWIGRRDVQPDFLGNALGLGLSIDKFGIDYFDVSPGQELHGALFLGCADGVVIFGSGT